MKACRASLKARARDLDHGRIWHAAACSTTTRNARETAKLQGGRTMQIQRLIARALRAAVDLKALGDSPLLSV